MLNSQKFLIAIVLVILSFAIWKRVGPNTGKKQVQVVADRNSELRRQSQTVQQTKACTTAVDKPKCFIEFVARNGGVQYATDLGLFNGTAMSICEKNLDCFFDAIDRLIPLVDPTRIKSTIASHIAGEKNSMFQDICDVQLKFGASYLKRHREMLLSFQKRNPSKTEISHYISTIDTKLKSWPN